MPPNGNLYDVQDAFSPLSPPPSETPTVGFYPRLSLRHNVAIACLPMSIATARVSVLSLESAVVYVSHWRSSREFILPSSPEGSCQLRPRQFWPLGIHIIFRLPRLSASILLAFSLVNAMSLRGTSTARVIIQHTGVNLPNSLGHGRRTLRENWMAAGEYSRCLQSEDTAADGGRVLTPIPN